MQVPSAPQRETSGGPLLAEVLAGGAPQRVGWFRFYFDDDRWQWSAQVQRMHGYAPGTVTPTTDLVLSHKHPDDYRHVADNPGADPPNPPGVFHAASNHRRPGADPPCGRDR